jgi:hypothetical protein
MRQLGPISGWRCAHGPTYAYDPLHERPDSTLLSDRPEDVLVGRDPLLQVDRVEANLQGGDTVVWTHMRSSDQLAATAGGDQTDESGERRVYVLSPGRQQAVDLDVSEFRSPICYSRLGDWRIVAEHGLQ